MCRAEPLHGSDVSLPGGGTQVSGEGSKTLPGQDRCCGRLRALIEASGSEGVWPHSLGRCWCEGTADS